MSKTQLINVLKDPMKEITTIRKGIEPQLIEDFLNEQSLAVKDILNRLQISRSTYFSKKKTRIPLDSSTTEKFFRLISTLYLANEILGKEAARHWLYSAIPALGEQAPIDLLDTEAGHKLVGEMLMQIKYGIYA